MKVLTSLIAVLLAFLTAITPAYAATTLTPFGDARINPDGSATLVSDVSNADTTDDFSGVGLSIPTRMLFSNLTTLSTTYNVTDDDCIGGSPRFQIHLNTPSGIKPMFIYLGPAPSFTGCAAGNQTSGNLIGSDDARFNLTKLGVAFYGTYADALSLVGNYTIEGIQLVTDSGWGLPDKEQTVTISNPVVNFALASAKDQCKGNGFSNFANPTFKNQGQCVAYFSSGGKNFK